MSRAGSLADRLPFLRHRRAEAGRPADPRRRGISDEEWRTQGTLTPEAGRQVKEALAKGLGRPLEAPGRADVQWPCWPLAAQITEGQGTARRRLGATFTARPAPPTVPMDALPDGRDVLEHVLHALQGLDFGQLDAARERRVTYAARGRAPLGDALASAWRPAVRPERRHGEAVAARLAGLYPPCDVTAPDHAAAYISLMRHLDQLTGTQGRNRWALPAITSGSAR